MMWVVRIIILFTVFMAFDIVADHIDKEKGKENWLVWLVLLPYRSVLRNDSVGISFQIKILRSFLLDFLRKF